MGAKLRPYLALSHFLNVRLSNVTSSFGTLVDSFENGSPPTGAVECRPQPGACGPRAERPRLTTAFCWPTTGLELDVHADGSGKDFFGVDDRILRRSFDCDRQITQQWKSGRKPSLCIRGQSRVLGLVVAIVVPAFVVGRFHPQDGPLDRLVGPSVRYGAGKTGIFGGFLSGEL